MWRPVWCKSPQVIVVTAQLSEPASLCTYQRTDGAVLQLNPPLTSTLHPKSDIYWKSTRSPLNCTDVSKCRCMFVKEIYLCLHTKSNIYYTLAVILSFLSASFKSRRHTPHIETPAFYSCHSLEVGRAQRPPEIRSKLHRIDVFEYKTVDCREQAKRTTFQNWLAFSGIVRQQVPRTSESCLCRCLNELRLEHLETKAQPSVFLIGSNSGRA